MLHMPVLRAASAFLSVCIISMGFAQAAHAGVVGTQTMTAQAERAAQIERVQSLMASDQVRAQLVALGVDPEWATQRVSSLTDDELARLNAQMAEMPAGAGVIYIVGVVFIVLLILELTGTIDIFKKA